MHVLILTQWYAPEPVKVRTDLAESLQALGHEVTVVAGFPNYPYGRTYPGYRQRLWQRESRNGVTMIRVPVYPDHSRSGFRRALNFLSYCASAALLGPFLVSKPDIIHVIHPPLTLGPVAWYMSRLWGVPFTYEIKDLWPETLQATGMLTDVRLLSLVERLGRWVYRRAAAISVVSPGFRAALIAKGIPAEKIRVISNWVDTDFYRPMPPDPALAERLGLAGRFNVMFAGGIGIAQHLDTVLEAAEILADLPSVQWVIVGDGVDLPRLQEAARARSIANVRFLGRHPESAMPGLYALADVLLVHLVTDPLFRITIPHKIFAYMACGKPILAAVEGDAADIVRNTKAGVTCAPCDAAVLAETLRRMSMMPQAERDALARNGRHAAVDEYGRTRLAREIERMLEGAVTAERVRRVAIAPRRELQSPQGGEVVDLGSKRGENWALKDLGQPDGTRSAPFGATNGDRDLLADGQAWREWLQKQRRYESWQRRIYNNLASRAGAHERQELEVLAEDFMRFARPVGAMLEIGCGAGRAASFVPQVRYFGIDPLVQRTSDGFVFCQALGEQLPFRDASFDCVIAFSVLDHVANLDAVLAESRRVLKPGGLFAVMNQVHPGKRSLGHAWRLLQRALVKLWRGDLTVLPRACWFLLRGDDMFHMRRFTREDLLCAFGRHFARVRTDGRDNVLYVQAEN